MTPQQAWEIRQALEDINQSTTLELDELTRKYDGLDALSTQATADHAGHARHAGHLDHSGHAATAGDRRLAGDRRVDDRGAHPADWISQDRRTPSSPRVHLCVSRTGRQTRACDECPQVRRRRPVSPGLPSPKPPAPKSGDLGRGWLDRPATVSGATAAHPAATEATETTVTPALAETSSIWLQPVDPAPAPGSVPFDSGLHQADETTQPPPVTTAPSSTAPDPSPGAAFHTPSWLTDDFTVERALIADKLPPGFDASRLIAQADTFEQFGLAEELAAGQLPIRTIDVLLEGHRATDVGGRNTLCIVYLHAMKKSIEEALRDAHPGRVDTQRLDQVRELLRLRGEPAPPGAASATGVAAHEVTEIDRLRGTGAGVSHPPPPPPPSAPEHTGVGVAAPGSPGGRRRSRTCRPLRVTASSAVRIAWIASSAASRSQDRRGHVGADVHQHPAVFGLPLFRYPVGGQLAILRQGLTRPAQCLGGRAFQKPRVDLALRWRPPGLGRKQIPDPPPRPGLPRRRSCPAPLGASDGRGHA